MDKDIIDILRRLQREREKKMNNKKRTDPVTDYCYIHSSDKEKLIISTYERVTRESVAAKAVYKTVDYVHKIYNLTPDEAEKLFDEFFYPLANFLKNNK